MLKFEFSEEAKQFALLRTTDKITFEFSVNPDAKDMFLKWIAILSSVEFKVDVALNNIDIKEYSNRILFRVRASGTDEHLNRWVDNLNCVSSFLRDEYDITYIKNIDEQEE